MPLDRPVAANGHNGSRVHLPGVYSSVLQQVCRETADVDLHAWAYRLTADPGELAAFDQKVAARCEELIEQLRGTTLSVPSHMLPDDLPPPFEQFPPGHQRIFTFSPDDIITEGE
jgi:hypothetical protein